MALIISWFETDDIFQRVSILFLLACLFGFTTNITVSPLYKVPNETRVSILTSPSNPSKQPTQPS